MSVFYVRSDVINQNVKIINTSDIEDEFLLHRLASVPSLRIVQECEKFSCVVEISDDKVSVKGNCLYEFRGRISKSDTYLFVHALFYNIFYISGYICIHAGAVFDNDGEVILFVGDFGAGKSHLNHFFSENGYKICSADHCLIEIEKGQPVFVSGSCFNKIKEYISQIDYSQCNAKRPIKKILFLQGIQDGGKVDFKEIKNIETIAQKLSTHVFWPYFSCAISMEEKSFMRMFPQNMQGYMSFWANIGKIYLCRGDKAKIFEAIKNENRDG